MLEQHIFIMLFAQKKKRRKAFASGAFWRSGRDSNPRAAFDDNTISSRARYDLFDTTAYSFFAANSKIYYTKFLMLVNTYFAISQRNYGQDVPKSGARKK